MSGLGKAALSCMNSHNDLVERSIIARGASKSHDMVIFHLIASYHVQETHR